MVNQNTGRGFLITGVALIFLFQAPRLKFGTLGAPGPGLFPIIVAGALLTLGLLMIVRSYFMQTVPLDFRLRNITLVTIGLVSFAIVSEYVNMLVAIAVLTTIASLASDDFSIKRTAAITGVLCVIAFGLVRGLGVSLPLY